MNSLSPVHRMRGRFMSFGIWTSVVAFVVIEGDALLDQSEIGHASTLFMLGTACLAAAACVGLFAIIMAIGLAISAAFSDEAPPQQSDHIQDAHFGQPPAISLAPGRSRSRRHQQRRPARTVPTQPPKPPPRALSPGSGQFNL